MHTRNNHWGTISKRKLRNAIAELLGNKRRSTYNLKKTIFLEWKKAQRTLFCIAQTYRLSVWDRKLYGAKLHILPRVMTGHSLFCSLLRQARWCSLDALQLDISFGWLQCLLFSQQPYGKVVDRNSDVFIFWLTQPRPAFPPQESLACHFTFGSSLSHRTHNHIFHFLEEETKVKQAIGQRCALRKTGGCEYLGKQTFWVLCSTIYKQAHYSNYTVLISGKTDEPRSLDATTELFHVMFIFAIQSKMFSNLLPLLSTQRRRFEGLRFFIFCSITKTSCNAFF